MGAVENLKSYHFGRNTPARGALVRFRVYIPGCVPGDEPIANYGGHGTFIGECADGFMVRVVGCTKQANIGQTVFVCHLHDEVERAARGAL